MFSLDKDLHGCPVLRRQEPPPRGTGASCGFWQVRRARFSEARVRRTVFSLTKTYMEVGNPEVIYPLLQRRNPNRTLIL